jgi:hypothetical protein
MKRSSVAVLMALALSVGINIGHWTTGGEKVAYAGGITDLGITQDFDATSLQNGVPPNNTYSAGAASRFVTTCSEDGRTLYLWHVYYSWGPHNYPRALPRGQGSEDSHFYVNFMGTSTLDPDQTGVMATNEGYQ